MEYKVTIFITLFNQEELVVRALESIPRRDDIEIIVVDDGSTDNSWEVVNEYSRLHPDLNIVLVHQKNRGIGGAKNAAYSLARGEYLYELDNDDYLYTGEFLKALNELDGTDMVYVNLRINDGSLFILGPENKNFFVAGTTHFIRREFLGNRRTREDTPIEDLYLNQELQAIPHSEKFTNLVVYHYNHPREGSLIWQVVNKKISV